MALLLGKPIAERILSRAKADIARSSVTPGLAVIQVGDYIESHKYVGLKEARATEVGVRFQKFLFPESVSREEIFRCIETLNGRTDVHGIIVQLPLPDRLPTDEIIAHIDPKKDADGFHAATLERFLSGDLTVCPVFPRAILELIRETGATFHGESAVVIVNSELLGRVLSFALSSEGLVGEYVLSRTGAEAIAAKTLGARVVVTASGIPDLLTADMLAPDAIVIDGGNVHVDGKVQGDVKREEVENKIDFLSPVPGGVGPVTVALLIARVATLALDEPNGESILES